MNTEFRVFAFLTLFFVAETLIYLFGTHWSEPAGLIALLLSGVFCFGIAYYVRWIGHKIEPRPEDDLNGSDAIVEGHYGDFSAASIWPVLMALTMAIAALGIAIDWWIFILNVPVAALCIVGWSMQEFRG